jgi:succinyldiaminopimelate transaminase
VNPVLTNSPPYSLAQFDAKKDAVRARGLKLYDFTLGDPKEPTPTFIRDAMIANIPSVSQYPTVAGRKSLRDAISGYFQRRFNLSVDPEREIIPASGAKEAVFHLPFAIIDRDSEKRVVVWGEPGYPVYERGTAYAGGIGYAAPLRAERNFLLEPADIPEDVLKSTCLFWLNYPHNPTGAVADLAYFQRVVEASRKYGFIVAADETYADIYFREPPHSLLEVARENVLVLHSLSKRSGMTGYRSGFMAGDPKIIAALKKLRPSVGVASPEFVQAAAEAAWKDDAHVAERRAIFGQKREKVLAMCRELGLEALDSGAGLYVWITAPKGETGESYAERLLEGGVVVSPGNAFGGPGEKYFRIALVPLLNEFEAAMEAWRKAHGAKSA